MCAAATSINVAVVGDLGPVVAALIRRSRKMQPYTGTTSDSVQNSRAVAMAPLVEPAWLEAHLEDTDLRILDATIQVKLRPFPRMRSGKREWKRAHIPGAAFADLRKICDPQTPARTFTMPDADWFAAQMGRLGIGDRTRVVVYDARESMWAARLWWMLRAFGFDKAAVLNGGWTAWQLERRPISSQPSSYPPTTFTPAPQPGLFVGKDEVLRAIDDPKACVVCALGRRQYRGERREYGRRRGHIPGACNVSAWRILNRPTQRYRPPDELRELFGPILDAEQIITYCGGGVAAASDAFVLHLLGHLNVAVYDGGFIEWSADKRLPLELGDARPHPASSATQ
jgi:thiosulfate/3-mercaptopyruvate sulfurtransferase